MHRRHHIIAGLALAAVLMAIPAAAQAQTQIHTFDGTCAGNFTAELSSPVTLLPTAVTWTQEGAGECWGTLDGQSLHREGVPVRFTGSGTGVVSCAGEVIDSGRVAIVFPPAEPAGEERVLDGVMDVLVDVGPRGFFTGRGVDGGRFVGEQLINGTSSTFGDCMTTGVPAPPYTIQISTTEPMRG